MHPNTKKRTETLVCGPMGGLGVFVVKNPDVTSWHKLFDLIALVHPVLHRVSCSYEMIPNAPKYYEGLMGWIGCVRCEKSHRDFCMIPNAQKHYETHQNMSLGSNRVDHVCLLGKITT